MGDKGTGGCFERLHPDYREYYFKFIVPRDLTEREVLEALNRCLWKYVSEHNRIGYRSPYYIKEEDERNCV